MGIGWPLLFVGWLVPKTSMLTLVVCGLNDGPPAKQNGRRHFCVVITRCAQAIITRGSKDY